MATTQEVWEHHAGGFIGRDVAMVLEDYTEASVLIENGEVYKGLEAIGAWFSNLFVALPKDCAFDLTNCTILDDHIYITWTAESETLAIEFATDTFAVKDGKITLQTIGVIKRSK